MRNRDHRRLKYLVALVLLPSALASSPAAAQDVTGDWFATLEVGRAVKLRLVLHVQEAEEGYSATLDSPDQGVTDIPLDELLVEEGYILAFQDVRGRYMSEGEFVDVRPFNPNKTSEEDIDENSDTWDTIDWLVKNVPHNNGRVGIIGISYPGFYATMSLPDAHPA